MKNEAFKDLLRCKPSHMPMLLDYNSRLTGTVISTTILVSAKQATKWKEEMSVEKDQRSTDVTLLHFLSLLNLIFSNQ